MSEPTEESAPPRPGDVIDDKYRCERVIGQGGMGAVVQATHLLRQAPVALKFMSAGAAKRPEFVERFVNEAVAASRIDSEHVVKIFDVSRLPDGTPYLVMEYLDGQELGGLLAQEGNPGLESCERAVHFALQVLRALQVAHGAGITHRDMKPANCFVTTRDEEPDFLKVIDFGISKIEQADSVRLTKTHAVLGTPLYMAPEQVRAARRADHRTDLYATGLILYELLTGRTPFYSEESGLAGLFAEVLLGDPTPLGALRSDLPEGLAEVVHKALARDPDDRYQSAVEMADALAPFADDRSTEVLRRLWRRAGRGVESSLRPPPGSSLPAIGSAVLRAPALPGSGAWGGVGVGTQAATSPSVPPPARDRALDASASDAEPPEHAPAPTADARTAASPVSDGHEHPQATAGVDRGRAAAASSAKAARRAAPSEVGDSAAAVTATAADPGTAGGSATLRWAVAAGLVALAAAVYFVASGGDPRTDDSSAPPASEAPTTMADSTVSGGVGAVDGADGVDDTAPEGIAGGGPSGRVVAADAARSAVAGQAPTSPHAPAAPASAAPSAAAVSAPSAPTATATRPKPLGEIEIER